MDQTVDLGVYYTVTDCNLCFLCLLSVCQAASMMRKDVNKPKGKTSAYAFFVQTCREEHRKKNPEQSVNFAEFSKKCSERWKVRWGGGVCVCIERQHVSAC